MAPRYLLGNMQVYTLLGMCEDMDSNEIKERGSTDQKKIWKATLLRALKEIGGTLLNKENPEYD